MRILEAAGQAIDQLAFAVSPEWGNRRQAHRLSRELLDRNTKIVKDAGFKKRARARLRKRSFKQAEPDPNRDDRYVTQDRSINSLLEEQLADLQVRSIGLYGENSIAHSIIENRVTYEVGAGLKIKPTVKESRHVSAKQAKKINEVLAETIRCWSLHGVDKSRKMSLGMAQRLMVREFANYGECFMLLGDAPYSGKGIHQGPVPTAIEFISPMRVETPPEFLNSPSVRMGVRYRNKQIVGYYVRTNTPNDEKEIDSLEYKYYPRFDDAGNARMVHIFEPMFAGQARGIPYITAAMNKILDFDDYQEAEIIAKQIEACFGLVFKVKRPEDVSSHYELAEAAAEQKENPDDQLMERITPGFIERIGEDDDITTVDPARPGSNYAPFLEGSIRMIAAAANQPYELIAKNFFRTTYSSGKLAMLDGKMGFTCRRSTLIDMGCIPIYARVVSDRVFADEADGTIPIEDWIKNPDAYTPHKYQVKEMGEIDQVKEMNAFKIGKAAGIVNESDYHDEQGNDWEAHREQSFIERKREIDDQLELEVYEMKQRESKGLPPKDPEPDDPNEPDKKESKEKKPALAA